MPWFKNFKTKLMLAFSLPAILLNMGGYYGVQEIKTIKNLSDVLYKKYALGLADLEEANIQLLMISPAVRNAILDDDPAVIQKRSDNIKKYREEYPTHFNNYRAVITLDTSRKKAADVLQQFDALGPEQDKILELA